MATTTMRLGLLLIFALAIIQISKGESETEDQYQLEQNIEGNMMASSMEEADLRTIREAGQKGEQDKAIKRRKKKKANKNRKSRRKSRNGTKKKLNGRRNKKGAKKGRKSGRKSGKGANRRIRKKNRNNKDKKSRKSAKKSMKSGKKSRKSGKKSRKIRKRLNKSKNNKPNGNNRIVGSNRQAACDEAALCQKIKDYIKYSNQLRKVKRIVKSCDTMEKKANKSVTEFDATVAALDEVIASNAKRRLYIRWRRTQRSTDEVVAIRDNLKNCSVSVKAKCEKKVQPACLEIALLTECEAALQAWLNKFGPKTGSCLQANADCCACITALGSVDAKCLDFDTKSTAAVKSKKTCTGSGTGAFGFCRKQQQEAAVKGPPAAQEACSGNTATKAPAAATTAAAGATTAAAAATTAAAQGIVECETRNGTRQCSSSCAVHNEGYTCDNCNNPVCSEFRDTCCCQIGKKNCDQGKCTDGAACYTAPGNLTSGETDIESGTTAAIPTTTSTLPTPDVASTSTCLTKFNDSVINNYTCNECKLGTKCQIWRDTCCCERGNNSCLQPECTLANTCSWKNVTQPPLAESDCPSSFGTYKNEFTCNNCTVGSDCQRWRDTCCCRVGNNSCAQLPCTNMSTCVSLATPDLKCTSIFPNPDNTMECSDDDCNTKNNATCLRWRDTCCCQLGTKNCAQDPCITGAKCHKGQNRYELFRLDYQQVGNKKSRSPRINFKVSKEVEEEG